ncbi:MAG: hypothetical protein Q8Q03_03095 [bacterium]|nr:hypothetical protein [bacterium]
MLELKAERINTVLKMPLVYCNKEGGGAAPYKANVGHYHIDGAYGGFSLHQTENEHGGVRNVFGIGHIPARELFNLMAAFLEGVRAAGEVTV